MVATLKPDPSCTFVGRQWKGKFLQVPHEVLFNLGSLGLTKTAEKVLLYIASYQWTSDSKAFVSFTTIGRDCNLSPRQVSRVVHSIADKGLIHLMPRWEKPSLKAVMDAQAHDRRATQLALLQGLPPPPRTLPRGRTRSYWYDLSPLVPAIRAASSQRAADEAEAKRRLTTWETGEEARSTCLHAPSFGHSERDVVFHDVSSRIPDIGDRYQATTPSGDTRPGCRVMGVADVRLSKHEEPNTHETNLSQNELNLLRASPAALMFVSPARSRGSEFGSSQLEKLNGETTQCVDAFEEDLAMAVVHDALKQAIQKTVAEKAAKAAEKSKARAERRSKSLKSSGEPAVGQVARHLWETIWVPGMRNLYPDQELVPWGGKEIGQVKALTRKLNLATVELGMRYLLANWEAIHLKWWKRKPGPGDIPSLGILLSSGGASLFHAAQALKNTGDSNTKMAESAQTMKSPEQVLADVEKEIEEFLKGKDKYAQIPYEMLRRRTEAQRAAFKRSNP